MAVRIDLHRLDSELAELFEFPVETGRILLYGSSFFHVWGHERAARQMNEQGFDIVNNGFGGATAEELLFYHHRLVRPFAPRALILRGGINDLLNGYPLEQAIDMAERVLAWTRADFPEVRLGVIPAFDCPCKATASHIAQRTPFHEALRTHLWAPYNEAMRAFCKTDGNAAYLDITPFFYEDPADTGSLEGFKDIFVEDGLHLTDEGYEQFAPYFADLLRQNGF